MKAEFSAIIWIFLSAARLVSGNLQIDVAAPNRIERNSRVQLTCTMQYARSGVLPDDTCSLWWSKPGEDHAHAHKQQMLKYPQVSDEGVNIVTERGKDRRPRKSVLTIPHMRTELSGRYSCHIWCSKVMETGTVTLTMLPDTFDAILGDEASVIGAIVTIFAIFTICIASCCCVAMELCKRKPPHGNRVETASDCEDAQLFNNSGSVTSLTSSFLEDAPPRYSLVVVSSSDATNGNVNVSLTSPSRGAQTESCQGTPPNGGSDGSRTSTASHVLNAITQQDNISGLFVIPSPPPNYRQALLDMAEKGVIFNPESLRPPPPSYDELVDVDRTASNGSPQPER